MFASVEPSAATLICAFLDLPIGAAMLRGTPKELVCIFAKGENYGSARSSPRRRRSSAPHLYLRVPSRAKREIKKRIPLAGILFFICIGAHILIENLQGGSLFCDRGFTLKRSLIIIEISTDMFCIIPIIPIGFLPLKSVSGRCQRTGR